MATLIGSQLRAARELRCLTVNDVAHETRIPAQRIQWLEQDNYAAFGSLTYARAFLKIYSRYLRVNAEELLEELPSSRLRGVCDYRHLTTHLGPWIATSPPPLASKVVAGRGHRSPVFTGLFIFTLMLASTGYWGHQLSLNRIEAGANAQVYATEQTRAVGKAHAVQRKVGQSTNRPLTQVSSGFDAGIPPTLR